MSTRMQSYSYLERRLFAAINRNLYILRHFRHHSFAWYLYQYTWMIDHAMPWPGMHIGQLYRL